MSNLTKMQELDLLVDNVKKCSTDQRLIEKLYDGNTLKRKMFYNGMIDSFKLHIRYNPFLLKTRILVKNFSNRTTIKSIEISHYTIQDTTILGVTDILDGKYFLIYRDGKKYTDHPYKNEEKHDVDIINVIDTEHLSMLNEEISMLNVQLFDSDNSIYNLLDSISKPKIDIPTDLDSYKNSFMNFINITNSIYRDDKLEDGRNIAKSIPYMEYKDGKIENIISSINKVYMNLQFKYKDNLVSVYKSTMSYNPLINITDMNGKKVFFGPFHIGNMMNTINTPYYINNITMNQYIMDMVVYILSNGDVLTESDYIMENLPNFNTKFSIIDKIDNNNSYINDNLRKNNFTIDRKNVFVNDDIDHHILDMHVRYLSDSGIYGSINIKYKEYDIYARLDIDDYTDFDYLAIYKNDRLIYSFYNNTGFKYPSKDINSDIDKAKSIIADSILYILNNLDIYDYNIATLNG